MTTQKQVTNELEELFEQEDELCIDVRYLDDDLTLAVRNTVDSDVMPEKGDRQALREKYKSVAERLLNVVEENSGNRLAYNFGEIVAEYTSQHNVTPVELFNILSVNGVSREEALAYTAFAFVYEKDNFPTDVDPFVVYALVNKYDRNDKVKKIAKNIAEHPSHIEHKTLNVFASLAENDTININKVAEMLAREDVENIVSGVEHIYVLLGKAIPDRSKIKERMESDEKQNQTDRGRLILPDENSNNQTEGGGKKSTNGNREITQRSGENQTIDDLNQDSNSVNEVDEKEEQMDEILGVIRNAIENEENAIDEAWQIGSAMVKGKEDYGISYSEMLESADISYTKQKAVAARRIANVFEYEEYPKNASVTGLYRCLTSFDDAGSARDVLGQIDSPERKITYPVAGVWRDLGSGSIDTVTQKVIDEDISSVVETIQLIYRLSGQTAPSEQRIALLIEHNIVTGSIGDDNVVDQLDELDTVLREEYKRLDQNEGGCDKYWQIGQLIEEFNDLYEYTYQSIRKITGMSQSTEQGARTVYRLYEYREYPDDWSPTAIYRASQLFETTVDCRQALDRCVEIKCPLTTNVVKIASEHQTINLAEIAEHVNEENVSDPANVIQLVYCLQGEEIPDTQEITDALEPSSEGDKGEVTNEHQANKKLNDRGSPIVEYLENFEYIQAVITNTGKWAQKLEESNVDSHTFNPSPKHFALEYASDKIEDATIHSVRKMSDEPLFIPDPDLQDDIISTVVLTYAANGGDTLLYLGEFPPSEKSIETLIREITLHFVYVTTIQAGKQKEEHKNLHVFTRNGNKPEYTE